MPPKKQTPPRRKRIIDDEPVYFAAKTGVLPISSAEYDWVNPTTRVVKPAVELHFGDKGVTRAFDPSHPDDAKLIKVVRDWIAEGRDERIHFLKVREIRPDNAPPFGNWDSINAKSIELLAGEGAFDVRKAVVYEESKGDDARADVLEVLYALLEAPADDPLTVSA